MKIIKNENDIITWKIGNSALVLSKTYFIALIFIISTITIIYILRLTLNGANIIHYGKLQRLSLGEKIDLTWQDFEKDCNINTNFGNPIRSMKIFNERYEGKVVNWDGFVNRIQLGYFASHLIYMNMSKNRGEINRGNDDLGTIDK